MAASAVDCMTWLEQAACKDTDTAIFYPVPQNPIGRRKKGVDKSIMYLPAIAICAQCTVVDQCLKAAMVEETGRSLRFGVRGGLTPRQRSALPRRTCRWCHDWFDIPARTGTGGTPPRYCGDTCRDAYRAQRRIEENERQRIERWTDDPTECEVCGRVSPTSQGLSAHRRQAHGLGAAA